jgi:GT2 family glycosyltransferase
MPDVAAIVANWNGGALAVDSVASIVGQTCRPDVWVIDNASTDGSCEAIAARFPQVHIVRNDRNVGYAAAVNQGIAAAGDARCVLLANNDIVLPEDASLAAAVAHMTAHPEVSGICGRYEYPDGEFQRFYSQLPTEFDMIVTWGAGRHVAPLLTHRRSREYYLIDRDFTQPMTIEQPAFSCVLLRGEAMRGVGSLDERFPIFFNDVDYCWRWREHGFTWHYLPAWRIVHDKSRSTGGLPLLRAELAGSAMRFATKHFSGTSRLRIRLAILLEVAWRKWRHRDLPVPIASIWQERLFHVAEPGRRAA